MILLGVNIDHVATLRNARGGVEPDPVAAAILSEAYGADGITAHLREDRRHINDDDIRLLKATVKTRLNMEMAVTEEMVGIALEIKPYMVTLVPERREEVTTEGGLDILKHKVQIQTATKRLMDAGILVSLFIDPSPEQVQASKEVGAPIVELHTGEYANAFLKGKEFAVAPLQKLTDAALLCQQLGLKLNAGHGLTYDNVEPIVHLPGMVELNIGHNIISRALFTGLGPAVQEMKELLR